MTFEEFWNKNYEKDYGPAEFPIEPYYGIASYAWEMAECEAEKEIVDRLTEIDRKLSEVV